MIALRSAAAVALVALATPALATTQAAKDALLQAAFVAKDKPTALAQVQRAEAAALDALKQNPNDRDAQLYRAMAIGYRAKLTKSRADATTAKALFEGLAGSDPRDAEAQAALGGWHLDAVGSLGGFLAGTVLGAKKAVGYAALDRSVTLGGGRAMFAGLDAMLRLQVDRNDARARPLAEQAAKGPAPQPIDRIFQKAAAAVLAPLRAGDNRGAADAAKRLLPFGKLDL